MATSNIFGDLTYHGEINVRSALNMPAGTIADAEVASDADIQYDKMQHVHAVVFNQADGAAAATEDRIVHISRTAETLIGYQYCIDGAAVGDSTVDIDIQKSTGGGAFATVLSPETQITSATANITAVDGSGDFDGTPTGVAGDLWKVAVAATAGTGTLPQGLCVVLWFAASGQ